MNNTSCIGSECFIQYCRAEQQKRLTRAECMPVYRRLRHTNTDSTTATSRPTSNWNCGQNIEVHTNHTLTTGGWWHLNQGGQACGNGWSGMVSNTVSMFLIIFHSLHSSPQQPPLTQTWVHTCECTHSNTHTTPKYTTF